MTLSDYLFVAHSVGIMVVQARAAEQIIDRDPAAAREPPATIRATGKAAPRRPPAQARPLRSDGDHQGSAPQPDLDALVERVRGAGLPVEVEVEGERRLVGPGAGLAACRVVQEALTNALKHARRACSSSPRSPSTSTSPRR